MDATSQPSEGLNSLRFILVALIVALLFGVSSAGHATVVEGPALNDVHSKTAARYRKVQQISAEQFAKMGKQNGRRPLVLDIREMDEFAVSHLAGAIQVDPNITVSEFLGRFASRFRARAIILYCSVGVRSTRLAARIQEAAKAAGAKATYNLAGGIFNWHNQSRPLVDLAGPTDRVHPYSWRWSELVTRRDLTSYAPVAR